MAKSQLVAGILLSLKDAESAVNNLTEEEFPARGISVVARNEADARAITDDAGPLKGAGAADLAQRLAALGTPAEDVQMYARAVEAGQVVMAVAVSEVSREAAVQTLQSYGAQHVLVV